MAGKGKPGRPRKKRAPETFDPDPSSELVRPLVRYPARSAPELDTLRRLLDVEEVPAGIHERPDFLSRVHQVESYFERPPEAPASAGWGAPIVGKWHNSGTKKHPKWVWVALPVGLAVGVLAAWQAERLAVDAWNAFPGSWFFGKARPVASLPTWIASWIVPSGADATTLSNQVQSLGTGNAPPAAGSLIGGGSLPGWLQSLVGTAQSWAKSAGAVTLQAISGTSYWQDPTGAVWSAPNVAQEAAFALMGYTSLGSSVTLYQWTDGSYHTTAQGATVTGQPGGPGPGVTSYNVNYTGSGPTPCAGGYTLMRGTTATTQYFMCVLNSAVANYIGAGMSIVTTPS